MVKGLLVDGHVLTCVRVDIVSFKVVVVDEAISLMGDILVPVVLEALAIEVFAKA